MCWPGECSCEIFFSLLRMTLCSFCQKSLNLAWISACWMCGDPDPKIILLTHGVRWLTILTWLKNRLQQDEHVWLHHHVHQPWGERNSKLLSVLYQLSCSSACPLSWWLVCCTHGRLSLCSGHAPAFFDSDRERTVGWWRKEHSKWLARHNNRRIYLKAANGMKEEGPTLDIAQAQTSTKLKHFFRPWGSCDCSKPSDVRFMVSCTQHLMFFRRLSRGGSIVHPLQRNVCHYVLSWSRAQDKSDVWHKGVPVWRSRTWKVSVNPEYCGILSGRRGFIFIETTSSRVTDEFTPLRFPSEAALSFFFHLRDDGEFYMLWKIDSDTQEMYETVSVLRHTLRANEFLLCRCVCIHFLFCCRTYREHSLFFRGP